MKINMRKFFTITGILLQLFSAGLVAHGIGEFEEASLLPAGREHVWDTNPPVNPDGSYPPLHEEGQIGSVLKELFGYEGSPSLLVVSSYCLYLALVVVLWRYRKTHVTIGAGKRAKKEK